VKRTVIGFMGCYAGVTALRTAQEIVRADPAHRVLIVSVELCSLHLQETREMDRLVSFCLFADGAAAAVVSSRPHGIALHEGFSWLSLGDAERMSWNIGDDGFAMTLDARVPARIRQMIREHPEAAGSCACAGPDDLWAVHPGGRMILDAVESAFGLSAAQMAPSRAVLREYGNMSSASILFVLAQLLGTQSPRRQRGHAIAFGPGLALEGIGFERLPAPAARSEGSGGTYPESQVSLEGVAAGPDYLARCPAP
jgi:alpha-pyrone synthase